jgi:hypothetical protein
MDGRDRAVLRFALAVVENTGGAPGAVPFKRPSGPSALKRSTQSRTICNPTPPIRAASEREPQSQISASAKKTPGLTGITRLPRQKPQSQIIEIIPQQKRSRHSKPPSVCHLESNRNRIGNPPNESPIQRLGISRQQVTNILVGRFRTSRRSPSSPNAKGSNDRQSPIVACCTIGKPHNITNQTIRASLILRRNLSQKL